MNATILALSSVVFSSLLLAACGSDTPNEIMSTDQSKNESLENPISSNESGKSEVVITTELTWENGASKIFANNCGFCHTSWTLNFELFKAKKSKIISRINSTTNPMPPTNSSKWLQDKEKALEYLSSADLK